MAQASSKPRFPVRSFPFWLGGLAVAVIVLTAAVFQSRWLPQLRTWIGLGALPSTTSNGTPTDSETVDGQDKGGHDDAHAGHNESDSIELSEQARKNIGLVVAKIELKSFTRSISIPGIIVERPGRSMVQATAPLAGIVTKIYPTEGEAVDPKQKMFDIRLTHEELVQSQSDLLRTTEELDVIGREIERIEKLTTDGGLAGKTLLERQYEQQKLQAGLRSQRQALVLHGLTSSQVDDILEQRKLLQMLTVEAPEQTDGMATTDEPRFYQVQSLKIAPGQYVNAGDTLAVLVDHSELFIEGNAFERDIDVIGRASIEGKPVSALLEVEGQRPQAISDLRILYAASEIDAESRTLHFYVTLPNTIEQNKKMDDGRRFISWRFRPGQRTQLQVPVENWDDRIVLPIAAVVDEGAEAYVFTPNGDHFDRRAVHVEYKDQSSVVIANDGVLFADDFVVTSGAKQLYLALKNKSGGGTDPHAGHNH